jgi:opacity protein-like surface antigen
MVSFELQPRLCDWRLLRSLPMRKLDMKKIAYLLLLGASFAATAAPALAADIIEEPPVVIEQPDPAPVVVEAAGGWYIRGDVGYAMNGDLEGDYVTYGTPGGSNTITGELDNSFSFGGGIGYQVTKHLRTDLTVDYFTSADFNGSTVGGPCSINGGPSIPNCISTDKSSYSALSVMANAYIDIATYGRFTPYVGAGIGATHVKWDQLSNVECDATNPASCNPTIFHEGGKGWRATGALMVGASIDVACNVKADVGYRFRHIEGGRMFEFAGAAGPGDHDAIQTHEVRAGLRYGFGGSGCGHHGGGNEYVAGDSGGPIYK